MNLEDIVAAHPAPYTITSANPADAEVIRILAPGKREDIHRAAGVCVDLERHTGGPLTITDAAGVVVPETTWRPFIRQTRS